jgi:glycerol-3-phosphate dehydrogenase
MWSERAREALWQRLSAEEWDVVVVGGGITGAAVLREAARAGLKALLLEGEDFAWGTSSRSTKLVHGGLRYLDGLQLGLVRESVRERRRLLAEGEGLVEPLPFLLAYRPSEGPRRLKLRAGVAAYHLLAGRAPRAPLTGAEVLAAAPLLSPEPGLAGLPYDEATVDDARLVLRLLREACLAGAHALSHARVRGLVRKGARGGDAAEQGGAVAGVEVQDVAGGGGGPVVCVRARAVVNATGAWADGLRAAVGGAPRLRPLRGSHVLLPASRLPLRAGVSFRHPEDRRFVCAVPWEGAVLVGTTDLDHRTPLAHAPAISPAELDYLLAAARAAFPAAGLTREDVLSTWAGVRPAVSGGEGQAPSAASREHLVLREEGLLTVTGGKLTTCRALAHQALRTLEGRLPPLRWALRDDAPFLTPAPPLPPTPGLDAAGAARLRGRYGPEAPAVLAAAAGRPAELAPVEGTATRWVELRWGARAEGARSLDDLLLRRTRLGLLLPRGGEALLASLRPLLAEELGWGAARFDAEARGYLERWQRHHGVPGVPGPSPAGAVGGAAGGPSAGGPSAGSRAGPALRAG